MRLTDDCCYFGEDKNEVVEGKLALFATVSANDGLQNAATHGET